MADAAQQLPAPSPARPSQRPRRSTAPRTRYRRSPGAVARPRTSPAPAPAPRASRLLGLARFIPFRGFVDLFFGGVSRNAELAAATQQRDLDRYRLTAAERAVARAARGAERLVRIARAANPLTQPAPAARPAARTVSRPALNPWPESLVEVAARAVTAPEPLNFPASLSRPRGGAPPRPSPRPLSFGLPGPLAFPPKRFFDVLGANPLLTAFKSPGVQSNPLASPLQLQEPLPAPEQGRCRCRSPKRKAGRPGKGFFVIDKRGREKRRYWLNREQREKAHARNAG